MKTQFPMRGDVWLADLAPVRGHEQGGRRPCLVVSTDMFNEGASGLVVVLPVTSNDKKIRFHVPLNPPEGGVKTVSFVKPEDIRSISKERLVKRLGVIAPATILLINDRLRALLDLVPSDV